MIQKVLNFLKNLWLWIQSNFNALFIIICIITLVILLFLVIGFFKFIKQEESIKRAMLIEEERAYLNQLRNPDPVESSHEVIDAKDYL